jgi:zinc protease
MYGSGLVRGESMDEIVNWPDDIQTVTREQVVAAARNAIVLNNSVTGWLMPPEAQP